MADENDNKPNVRGNKKVAIRYVYLLIVFVALIVFASMGYIFYSGNQITEAYVPLVFAAKEIKIHGTNGHLRFEELTGHDRNTGIDEALKYIDLADWYAKAMLDGGQNADGKFIPLHEPRMRQAIIEVRRKISEFRDVTLQRWQIRDTYGIGTEIEQNYHSVFNNLIQQADIVEAELRGLIARELKNFQMVQRVLITICFVVTVIVVISFSRFLRAEIKNELELQAANQQLNAYNQQLIASEQQLRAANQQLIASEQEAGILARFPSENPNPVLRISKDSTVLYCNRAGRVILDAWGCNENQCLCFPERENNLMKEAINSGNVVTFDLDSDNRTFSVTLAPFTEFEYVNIYALDITERKRAEIALRESESLLNEVGRISKIGGWRMDLITRKARWTKGTYDIVEIEQGEPIPGPDEHVEYYLPEYRPMIEKAMQGLIENNEPLDFIAELKTVKGNIKWCQALGRGVWADGKCVEVFGTFQDITERKQIELVNASRLHLMQFSFAHSLDELLEETINEAEKLTGSCIGFYHFVEDDQKSLTLQSWSTRTKREFCRAKGKGLHYGIDEAGVWVDCVYRREPVIHNDYACLEHRKGMPEGHAKVIRELVVPVIQDDKILAILGVGNKATDYVRQDVEMVSLLADLAWNIAERRRAEEALQDSENKLREAQQMARLGHWWWDVKTGQVEWSDEVYEIFRLDPQKFTPQIDSIQELSPWTVDHQRDKELIRRATKSRKQGSYEQRFLYPDGSTGYYFSTFQGIYDDSGQLIAIKGTVQDITELKMVQEQIRAERDKAQKYLDVAEVIFVVIDTEQNVKLINQKGCKLLGCKEEDIINKNWFNNFVPERFGKNIKDVFNRLVTGDTIPFEYFENPVITGDGEERIIAWHNTILRDEQGHIVGTLSSGEDITHRKIAEEQLFDYQEKLKSLASKLSVIEERERYRLATELHDQIGQSLVMSKLKLDSLRESVSSDMPAEILDDVRDCLRQVIQDTRTLTFDLSYPILYELGFEVAVAEWLNGQIRDKHNIETEFQDDGQLKPLDDDIRALLFRNVRELLFNVVKHAKAKKIKVSVSKVEGDICVVVEDDGVGFEPSEVVSHSGFGIFSIRERLEQLAGYFEIESKPGCGSKFTMKAPLKLETYSEGVEV
ncbi:MAG: PAS domain S-box protein [Sedimentisphaerales bacterium]|nr:PAS domain S-box protein [Sedimentisphaerales bacterium]